MEVKDTYYVRHYGKWIVIPLYALVLFLGYSGFNIIYNEFRFSLGNGVEARDKILIINFTSWLLISFIFPILTYFYYKKNKVLFLSLFILAAVLYQFFLSSSFIDLAQKENNYEINSDFGVIWVYLYPLNFIMLIVFGAIFDYIKNKARLSGSDQ